MTRPPLTILVVDDNADLTQSQRWLLELAGHTVHEANTAKDCMEVIETVSPDLVLLDLAMPYTSGFELCQRLRTHSSCQNAKIVAHSGSGDARTLRQTVEAGFDGHVLKPVDQKNLLDLVDSVGTLQENCAK